MKKKKDITLRIALCLFTGYLCLYLFTAPKKLPEGDEAIMMGVADRIAHHGFSRLTPQEAVKRISDNKIFSQYGFTEQSFSKFGIGQSLIDIPVLSYLILPSPIESYRNHFINYYIITLSIILALLLYIKYIQNASFVKFTILVLIVLDLLHNRSVFNQVSKDLKKAIYDSPVA